MEYPIVIARRLVLLTIVLLTTACATARAPGSDSGELPGTYRFRATDDKVALQDLERLFRDNGFPVLGVKGKTVRVRHKGKVYLLRPDLRGPGKIDRLVVITYWRVHEAAKKGKGLEKFVWDLNHTFNAAQFSLDQDKDLMILSQITFVDTLDVKMFEYFANWMDEFLMTRLARFPRVREFLK